MDREYLVYLDEKERYRHRHRRTGREIVGFAIQYEMLFKDKWLPVVRFDSWHGFSHRDLYHRDGTVTKTPLFISDLNDALTFAEEDLKANFKKYRDSFLKGE